MLTHIAICCTIFFDLTLQGKETVDIIHTQCMIKIFRGGGRGGGWGGVAVKDG